MAGNDGWGSPSTQEKAVKLHKMEIEKIARSVVNETALTKADKEALSRVKTFKDLPDPKENESKVYIVEQRQKLKAQGLYISNGKKWKKRAKVVILKAKEK